MNKDNIINIFKALANIDIDQIKQYIPIVDLSINEVNVMLKNNIDYEVNANRLESLCGAVAYYKYVLTQVCNQPEQIKAQDITISNSNQKNLLIAKQIRDDAFICVSDLIKDNNFYFRSVL